MGGFQVLAMYGADLEASEVSGNFPLYIAVVMRKKEIVKYSTAPLL